MLVCFLVNYFCLFVVGNQFGFVLCLFFFRVQYFGKGFVEVVFYFSIVGYVDVGIYLIQYFEQFCCVVFDGFVQFNWVQLFWLWVEGMECLESVFIVVVYEVVIFVIEVEQFQAGMGFVE